MSHSETRPDRGGAVVRAVLRGTPSASLIVQPEDRDGDPTEVDPLFRDEPLLASLAGASVISNEERAPCSNRPFLSK